MSVLNHIDYTVIVVYLTVLICFGLYLRKMASVSLEDYFLGGKRLPFGLLWLVSLLLLPMQLIIRTYTSFWITLGIFIISLIGLYFLWYKHLPPDREGVTNPGITGPLLPDGHQPGETNRNPQ